MILRSFGIGILGLLMVSVQGCHKDDTGASPSDRDTIATVSTCVVGRGAVSETIETFGTVTFDPHRIQSITFPRSGKITERLITSGQWVSRGDTLLKLGPLPDSNIEVEQARINLTFAERQRERLEKLRDLNLSTNEAVQQAERDVAQARATLASLGAADTASQILGITAPFTGTVMNVTAIQGAIVHLGDKAAEIAPTNGLVVEVGFEPEDAIVMQEGMNTLIIPVFQSSGGDTLSARLSELRSVVNPSTQLISALIRPTEFPHWLIAGARVKIRVLVHTAADAVRIPRDALSKRDGRNGVFSVHDRRARWTPITLGLRDDVWLEIRRGLQPGDSLVVTGRTSLSDGMMILSHEHGAP